jgi:hypothetical protein
MKNTQQDHTGEAADKELLFMPSSFSTGQQRLFDSPGTAEVTAKVPSHLSARIDMEVRDANRPVSVTNDAVTSRALALVLQHSDVSGSVERLGSHESESNDSMALEDVEEDVVEEEEDSEAARSEQEELSSNGSSSNAEHESSSCSGAESDCSSDESDVAIRVPSMTSLDRDAVVVDRRSGPHEQVATSGSASAALRQEEEYSIRLERRRASIAVLMARRGRHRPDNSTASRDIVATWQQLVARNEG